MAGLGHEGADGDRMITVPADLTDDDDRRRLFAVARQRLGALDLVINNAGVAQPASSRPTTPPCFARSSSSMSSRWPRSAASLSPSWPPAAIP